MTSIDELAVTIRAGLAQDEHFAREACGGTVVGEPGNWRQAPGGDEWAVDEEEFELEVALRPGLPRPPDHGSGLWGAVVRYRRDDSDPDAWVPLPHFRHMARWDPRRVLAEVVSKRALVDEVLGWEHGHAFSGEGCPVAPCLCGHDDRVLAILQHLAQPYQETT